jgi:hypothetical protein
MPRSRQAVELANGPTPKIVPQSDALPHVYLSHTVVHTKELEEEFLRCSGVRYRCFSFVYIDKNAFYFTPRSLQAYEVNVKAGNHIMMDSGAFSFHQFVEKQRDEAKGKALKVQTIKNYVKFCLENKKDWDFHVTFDYIKRSPLIWQVTKYLEGKGLRPVPVFHGDTSYDWLKKYLDAGYKRIGISSLAQRKSNYKHQRMYFDNVFRIAEPYQVKFHGFGMTALSYVYAYPWDSVDSSSWSRTASYGMIYMLDKERMRLGSVHVSQLGSWDKAQYASHTTTIATMSKEAVKSVKDQVEENGFDFDLLCRSLTYRFVYNGWMQAHLDQYKDYFKDVFTRWEPLI